MSALQSAQANGGGNPWETAQDQKTSPTLAIRSQYKIINLLKFRRNTINKMQ